MVSGQRLNRLVLWFASALALVALVITLLGLVAGVRLPGKAGWPEAWLLCTTTVATLAALTRHLPLQNVLLGAGIIALVGGLAHLLAAVTAIPFGPIQFGEGSGPQLAGHLGWAMPFVWVVAVLNSRGVARLILRPWRKIRAYGFWLMGFTVLLTVLFDAALEPFATRVKSFWLWEPTRLPLAWHEVPLTNFAGWLLTAGVIMAFAAPALINKNQRPKQTPPDYHPLVVWLLAMGLFAAGALHQQLWLAGGYGVVAGVVVGVFAVRGARW